MTSKDACTFSLPIMAVVYFTLFEKTRLKMSNPYPHDVHIYQPNFKPSYVNRLREEVWDNITRGDGDPEEKYWIFLRGDKIMFSTIKLITLILM